MPAVAEKFVVLSGAIGNTFRKGDVVPAESFGEGLPRLLDLKAVRPAGAEEALCERVEVIEGERRNLSYEAAVVERDREIAKLKMENASLRAEVNNLKYAAQGAVVAPTPTPPIDQGLMAEKDRLIEELQKRLVEAREAGEGQQEGRGHRGALKAAK